MAIELKEENLYYRNKKINVWNYFKSLYCFLNLISIIILFIIIITLITLINKYQINCNNVKDGAIECNIIEQKNNITYNFLIYGKIIDKNRIILV